MKQQAMKKQSGFTLIELVIVIIILGILAATAVPKFVNMQGDARAATLGGVKTALQGAANITYSRAAIKGVETKADGGSIDSVALVYGYPAATSTSILASTDLPTEDWNINVSVADDKAAIITPASAEIKTGAAADTSTCSVTYKQAATSGARPTITVKKDC